MCEPDKYTKLIELVDTLSSQIAALGPCSTNKASAGGPGSDADAGTSTSCPTPRVSAIESAEKILNVLRSPRDLLLELSFQHCATASLQVIQHYRIHHHIPLCGSRAYGDIAAAIGKAPASFFERIIQHAISFGLFQEDGHGRVLHNASSALLVTDPDLEAWLYLCTNVAYPAGAHIPKALAAYGASPESNESAFSVSIGKKISQFEHFRETHGLPEMFGSAMKGIANGGAYDIEHAINGYPWQKLKHNHVVVDVGGGIGHFSLALAAKYSCLRFEVQDLPETIEIGRKQCPPDLQNRISFRAHDFFRIQPVHDVADSESITYFARFILHDWSDQYAAHILEALAKSMRPQDRLVLNEVVIPPPGTLPRSAQRRLHDRDLLMLMNLNGRERSVSAFEDLFASVSPRLRLRHVFRPEQGELSLIEVALA